MKKKTAYMVMATLVTALAIRGITHKEPAKAETISSISYSKEYLADKNEKVFGVSSDLSIPDIYSLECVEEHIDYVIEVSQADIDLMVRVVMSEGSLLSVEGKQAIAETIINRVVSDQFPNTVSEVVYMPNAYSTANNGEPTTDCLDAVLTALEFHAYPDSMLYFRAGKYHDFAYPYMQIGNTFFSTQEDLQKIN